MKKTTLSHLRHLLFFTLPLLVLFGIGEYTLRTMPNAYETKASAMAARADTIETLVVGASHALMGIDPSHFDEPAYNLAFVSQTINLDAALLAHYLPQMPRLRTVVTVVDAGILFDPPLAEGDEAYRVTYYNLYLPLGHIGTPVVRNLEVASFTNLRNKLTALIKGDASPHITPSGFYDHDTPERVDTTMFAENIARDRAANHLRRGRTFLAPNKAALARVVSLCQARKLRLVVVATPTLPIYYTALDAWATEEVAATLRWCSQQTGVEVIDYSRDTRFTQADFFDPDHLNTRGTAKFSEILWHDMHTKTPH